MEIAPRRVDLPDFGVPVARPEIGAAEYAARVEALYQAAALDWVIVYGDREHLGNLVWLTGYDPRFEEALLVLGPRGRRVLIVGVEGLAYAEIAGLEAEIRFYHPFSIQGQPIEDSPPLAELLREIGLERGQRVGIAGWKRLGPREVDDATIPAFVPAFITRVVDAVTGTSAVDVTGLLTEPGTGVRTRNSAAQIAQFEWGAARASAAVLRVIRGTRPGMTEMEAAGLFGYQGEPLAVHPILVSSDGAMNALRGPSHRTIAEGDAISCALSYWGGLCCRAGLMQREPDDEFVREIVTPYYRAIATWWTTVGIDVTGGEIDAAVRGALAGASFHSFVNSGHLTGHEEWIDSPVRSGSPTRIAPGMLMQCDIIPTPLRPGWAINIEDTLAIGDRALRDELARDFPETWARIEAKRAFMRDKLGLALRPEVLPLSSMPGYLPPFWLDPELVCTVDA